MEGDIPKVGRIVHYVDTEERANRAAIITATEPDTEVVSLCVFQLDGALFLRSVRHDETGGPGTWHWPERA